MFLDVSVEIGNRDVKVGRLYQSIRHGTETATFSYDADYLAYANAFALAPDMPLGSGTFHSDGLQGQEEHALDALLS